MVSQYIEAAQSNLTSEQTDKEGAASIGILEVEKNPLATETIQQLNSISIDVLGASVAMTYSQNPEGTEAVLRTLDEAQQDIVRTHSATPGAKPELATSLYDDDVFMATKELNDPRIPDRFSELNRQVMRSNASRLDLIDTYGTVDREQYKEDIGNRLQVANELRRGEGVYDQYRGEERRPIIDIALDKKTANMLKGTIEKRSQGLDQAIEYMETLRESPAAERENSTETILTTLRSFGVWGYPHGVQGSDKDTSSRGTLADLYIDQQDIEKYDQINAMLQELKPHGHFDSLEQIENRIIHLAGSTFPSGVEFVHRFDEKALASIKEQGAIAPRAMRKHNRSKDIRRGVNGAFVHFTRPGTAATEYGGATIGVPIDVIAKHAPNMHSEDDYVGNKYFADTSQVYKTASVQEPLGKFVINDIGTMPRVFVDTLQTMQKNIKRGIRPTNIGQGDHNNFSFAASDSADTATSYTFPLEEVTIYDTNDRARFATLKPIDIHNGMVAYAPAENRLVPFLESTAFNGNNSNGNTLLELNIDNVSDESMVHYLPDLLEKGESPDELLEKARGVNPDNSTDLLSSYVKNIGAYEKNGLSLDRILKDGIGVETDIDDILRRIESSESDDSTPEWKVATKQKLLSYYETRMKYEIERREAQKQQQVQSAFRPVGGPPSGFSNTSASSDRAIF